MIGVHLSQAVTGTSLYFFTEKILHTTLYLAIKLCEFRGVKSAFIKGMWFVQTFIHGIWSLFEISNHQKRRLKSTLAKKVD